MSDTSQTVKTEQPEPLMSPFLSDNPPPIIRDPYSVPIEAINMIDGRLFQEDIQFAHFDRLRKEDPVHLNELPGFGRYWSITKFEDIMFVDKNHQLFSSAHGISIGPQIDTPEDSSQLNFSNFIAMDPPKHDLQRATVSGVVAPPNLAKLESTIRTRAGEILDNLPVGETFDWVDRVSIELTTQMLATLFDFPFEDRRKLTRWSDVATAPPGTGIVDTMEQKREELLECLTYFTRLWNERAAQSEPGSDLISMLAHGENTKNMAPLEFLGNLILLIVGGNDTTRNSMSASIYGSSLFPAEWEKVKANRELIPNTVAEIIRWQTPLAYMRRTALEDVEMHGQTIKKGDKVAMWYVSGNRDERKFENPNALIFDRENARNHISFGFGIHRCFGNRLAELQLQILWDEMLKRFSKIEVVGEPERNVSSFVKGYTKMTVIARA